MPGTNILQKLHRMSSTIRLSISCAVGLLFFALVSGQSAATRFMVVWLAFACTISLLFWLTFFSARPHEIVKIARKQDSSRTVIFLMVLLSAFISLIAVVLLLKDSPVNGQAGYYGHLLLSIMSVIFGWIVIHTVFTVRYAHLFYQSGSDENEIPDEKSGGLSFPGETDPDYLDFAYFAFVIGMTFQVSDVEITSARIRRIALVHGILSFAFNAIIVALCINIISGIIEK